ncbi:MAG: preprotein translocase subunit SecG [Clostridia bacterium]|nr:preprotein translocase subunit SecG [Clostridia bacterium]
MEIARYVLLGIDLVICIVIIVLMLLQAGKGAGSSIMGGSDDVGSNDGYLNNNKDRSRDAKLKRSTMFMGVCFMIITYVLGLLFLID